MSGRYGDDDDHEDELERRRAAQRPVDGPTKAVSLFIARPVVEKEPEPFVRGPLGDKVCARCKFVGLEHYRTCPKCEGIRNRSNVERTARLVKSFKQAIENANDQAWHDLRPQLVDATWPHYVDELEKAVAARVAANDGRKPRGRV